MICHNVVEIADPMEMWDQHDGTRAYVLHGRQPSPFCKGIEIVDFSGAGILAGKYVRNLEDARAALAGVGSQAALLDLVQGAKGSLALHAFDHTTRDYLILNDPLGGGQIYLKESADRTVLSSDLTSLADVCRFRNAPLRKNRPYFLTAVLTDTQTHGADTPYLDVALLRRGEGLRVLRSGKVERLAVSPPERLYFSGMSYRDGVDAFVQDMLENVTRSSAHDFDLKVSHLTAGFDSRLVLAAMVKSGVADSFIYYCIPTSPDFELSKRLAGHLGLRHTSTNDGNPAGRGHQNDYHEYVRNAPRATQFVLDLGPKFRYAPRNNLVFQGGYGEVARVFNQLRWDGDASQIGALAYQLWRYREFPAKNDPSSIWCEDYLNAVLRRLSDEVRQFKELGLPDDYFTNWFYIERRNRLFIGARTYYANHYRSQFDPIYSAHLAWLPATLDFDRRQANFVGADAMTAMSPLLASLPFDSEKKIGPLYRKERQMPKPTAFNGKAPEVVNLPKALAETMQWPGQPAVISKRAAETARNLGIAEIVAHGLETLAPIAFERLKDDPGMRGVLNADNLVDMRAPLEGLTTDRAQLLHKVLSALVLADLV